jgi:hypothetical protein
LAYITLTDAVKLLLSDRSNCAFDCQVCATSKPWLTAHGDCWAMVPVAAPPGNAGAPGAVPLNE